MICSFLVILESMEKENIKEYIESKQYFKDARDWYNWKYMLPMTHRVWTFYVALAVFIVLLSLIMNINKLLPIKERLTYGINVVSDIRMGETQAKVIEMAGFEGVNAPHRFIASNLIRNYVEVRENFVYGQIKKQYNYVKESSTRLVFKRYYNFMSVNNPDSPIMRYQQFATRNININDIKFLSNRKAKVRFVSRAVDINSKEFEKLYWEADISFNMSKVGRRVPTGTKFKFTVTDYKLKLLGEVE